MAKTLEMSLYLERTCLDSGHCRACTLQEEAFKPFFELEKRLL